MKNVSKRAILTVLLAIAFVVTFACGALFTLVMNQSNLAIAAGEAGTTAILSTDTTTVKRGGTVEVKVVIPMPADIENDDEYYWSAVSLAIGPLQTDESGNVAVDGTTNIPLGFDDSIAQHLSSVKDNADFDILDFGDLPLDAYGSPLAYNIDPMTPTSDHFTNPTQGEKGFFLWSLSLKSTATPQMRYHGTMELKVSFNVPTEMTANEITFGIAKLGIDGASIGKGDNSQEVVLEPNPQIGSTEALLAMNTVKVKVVDVATETNLKAVNVGHDTTLPADTTILTECKYEEPAGTYNTAATYNCEHFAMFPLLLQPVLADDTTGATVKVGFDSATVATSGEEVGDDGWVSLAKPVGETVPSKVYIYVQAENYEIAPETAKTQIYELELVHEYVGLESLVFTDYSAMAKTTDAADGSSTAPTKVGLFDIPEAGNNEAATTFDPEVLEYKYYLLSDSFQTDGDLSLTLTLNATVPEDAGISTSIALAEVVADGGTAGLTLPDPATATSGTAFDIETATASATYDLTLTVEKDGDSTVNKVYTIHVQVVNCDISITTLQARGLSKATYNSSDSKATQNAVDYYFSLNKETDTSSADVIFTTSAEKLQYHTETMDIDPTSTGTFSGLEVGESKIHTLLATAEAGNTQKYTFILATPSVLTLTLESEYQFLYAKADGGGFYRTAYEEDGLVHTKDDLSALSITKVVLGQIRPSTSLNTLLSNIDSTQHEILWIYDQNDTLIYSLGQVESAFENMKDNPSLLSVGTSWKVQLKASSTSTVIDEVYLSVLGDLNGDGVINAQDTAMINTQIRLGGSFSEEEVKLAGSASSTKSCVASAGDVSFLNNVISGKVDISDIYYKPTPAPAP